nr:MAG TPA: hypothetical protein [Caudoviricetes sp.]
MPDRRRPVSRTPTYSAYHAGNANNPLLCRSPACHAGYFVGKVGDFCFVHTSFVENIAIYWMM